MIILSFTKSHPIPFSPGLATRATPSLTKKHQSMWFLVMLWIREVWPKALYRQVVLLRPQWLNWLSLIFLNGIGLNVHVRLGNRSYLQLFLQHLPLTKVANRFSDWSWLKCLKVIEVIVFSFWFAPLWQLYCSWYHMISWRLWEVSCFKLDMFTDGFEDWLHAIVQLCVDEYDTRI